MDIRLARPEDAAGVLEIYGPFCHTPVSFEEEPPSLEEVRRRIAGTLEGFPWLVATKEGGVLGFAYAGPHRTRAAYRWSVDVAVYVHGDHRRAGVGRSLYSAFSGRHETVSLPESEPEAHPFGLSDSRLRYRGE